MRQREICGARLNDEVVETFSRRLSFVTSTSFALDTRALQRFCVRVTGTERRRGEEEQRLFCIFSGAEVQYYRVASSVIARARVAKV